MHTIKARSSVSPATKHGRTFDKAEAMHLLRHKGKVLELMVAIAALLHFATADLGGMYSLVTLSLVPL